MKMFREITKLIDHEPIIKNKRIFIRLHYENTLVATIDKTGDIQRQAPGKFKVFWDMGVLRILMCIGTDEDLYIISKTDEGFGEDLGSVINKNFTDALIEGVDKMMVDENE